LLAEGNESDDREAHEMTRISEALAPPRDRDAVLVRGSPEGTYWQAPDGLIVRVAAGEIDRDGEKIARELLSLACRDAEGQ
jgi:hypothetical protein